MCFKILNTSKQVIFSVTIISLMQYSLQLRQCMQGGIEPRVAKALTGIESCTHHQVGSCDLMFDLEVSAFPLSNTTLVSPSSDQGSFNNDRKPGKSVNKEFCCVIDSSFYSIGAIFIIYLFRLNMQNGKMESNNLPFGY